MRTVTKMIEDNIHRLLDNMGIMRSLAPEITELYWDHDVSNISAWTTANNGDSVTMSTKLSKSEVINGITLSENFYNFCNNVAAGQNDYIKFARHLATGNTTRVDVADEVIEALGDNMKSFGNLFIENYYLADRTMKLYFANQVNLAVGAISDGIIVYGTDVTKLEFMEAITLLEQFQKFCNNQAFAQADYTTTIAKWCQHK